MPSFSIETSSGGTGSQTFTVDPGNYSISENTLSNWKLDTVTVNGTEVGNGDAFNVDSGSTVKVTFTNESIPPGPVPELPAGILFGVGLAGVGGFVIIKRHARTVIANNINALPIAYTDNKTKLRSPLSKIRGGLLLLEGK